MVWCRPLTSTVYVAELLAGTLNVIRTAEVGV